MEVAVPRPQEEEAAQAPVVCPENSPPNRKTIKTTTQTITMRINPLRRPRRRPQRYQVTPFLNNLCLYYLFLMIILFVFGKFLIIKCSNRI